VTVVNVQDVFFPDMVLFISKISRAVKALIFLININ